MISQKPEQVFESPPRADRSRVTPETKGTYDERLDRILDAATQVFAEVGYEKASMRMVTKAAGVSLAGLYHYFDSKERILFLIQFRTFHSLLTTVREKLHGVTDPVEQLQRMVRAHVNYFANNMAALKVCSHELDSLSGSAYEENRAVRREYYDVTRAIVDRLFDEHDPGATPNRHVATMSLFGTLNWLYRWYDPKHGGSPATIAKQIAAQFLNGVLGASRQPEEADGAVDPLATP